MKKFIYMIYDEEADELLPPFFANNDAFAARMVKNSLKSHAFNNMDLTKLRVYKFTDVSCNEGHVYSDNECNELNSVCCINDLVDDEIQNKFDNEALAQSMTTCFQLALSKFLEENKRS